MSVLSVAPELVSVAAGDLSGIGSAICEANVVAAAPTLGVVAPAADSVSAELAALFGGHAQTYQAVSTQAGVFHREFVSTLSRSSAAYTLAEVESASGLGKGRTAEGLRLLGSRQHEVAAHAGSRLWQPGRSALWRPGMSDPRLITPGRSLPAGSRLWHPGVPGFKTHSLSAPGRFIPHNQLMGGISNGSRGIVQNIAALIKQIIENQIGYLKLLGTSLIDAVKDELTAILGLPVAFVQSIKDLLHGNISGAMNDVLKGFLRLFVNGLDWDGNILHFDGSPGTDWYEGAFTGALPDLWHITQIPADEMQNLADMLKPLGFGFAGKFVQNVFANPLNELANGWHIYLPKGSTPGFRMGAPLAFLFDVLGAPILSLEAFEDSLQSALNNLLALHLFRAGFDFLATPVNVLHAFLFGQGYLELPRFIAPYDGGSLLTGGTVHLGGIFAPLDYGEQYLASPSTGGVIYDGPALYPWMGTQTGGLVPELISMLPPILQNPLWGIGSFIDDVFEKLMSFIPLHPDVHV